MVGSTANAGTFWMEFFPPNEEHPVEVRRAWGSMLGARLNSDLPHQSPDFFDFLQDTEGALNIGLLAVRADETGDLVGIVPLRIMPFHLRYSVGHTLLAEPGFSAVTILPAANEADRAPRLQMQGRQMSK